MKKSLLLCITPVLLALHGCATAAQGSAAGARADQVCPELHHAAAHRR